MVYNGPVEVGTGGYLRFGPASQTALRFTNRLDENAVTITLTWNDYRDAEDAGTDKDLDLIVEDWRGRVVGESKLKQIAAGRDTADGETKNPRERLVLTDLPAAPAGKEYRIRVKAAAGTFGPRDRIRVMLSAARTQPLTDPDSGQTFLPVQFLNAVPRGEIYPPADHAGVITVGDSSTVSSVGPTADGRLKPDVIVADSVARFSNGEETVGSSNAAAYFAGNRFGPALPFASTSGRRCTTVAAYLPAGRPSKFVYVVGRNEPSPSVNPSALHFPFASSALRVTPAPTSGAPSK